MVTGLAKSKTNTDDEKAALEAARLALEPLRAELMRLADADSDAFDQVMAAYRRPKATDDEKAARSAAIQSALRQATVVPLETLRACAAAMPLAAQVAEAGNRSAASDAGVAIGLLEAAAAGAEANVRINLDGLKDESFNANVSSEASRLAAELAAAARRGARGARGSVSAVYLDRSSSLHAGHHPGARRGLEREGPRIDAGQQPHLGFVGDIDDQVRADLPNLDVLGSTGSPCVRASDITVVNDLLVGGPGVEQQRLVHRVFELVIGERRPGQPGRRRSGRPARGGS